MSIKKEYKELLRDRRWVEKRNRILSRDNNRCQMCGRTDSYLYIHHKYYSWGKLPWEYPDDALISLCKDCHNDAHMAKTETDLVSRFKRIDIPNINKNALEFWIKGSEKRCVYLHVNSSRIALNEEQAKFLIKALRSVVDSFSEEGLPK